jgi:hypothetical protein
VNAIYVTAASAADISAVHAEITNVLRDTRIATQGSLAREVTGSISSAEKLATDRGKWLSILVLIAAFAVAGLLTMAAVNPPGDRVRHPQSARAALTLHPSITFEVIALAVALALLGGLLAGALASWRIARLRPADALGRVA